MDAGAVRTRRLLSTRLIDRVTRDVGDTSTYRPTHSASIGGAIDSFFYLKPLLFVAALVALVPVDLMRYALDRHAQWS